MRPQKEINDPFDDQWPEQFVPRICSLISQADTKRHSEPDEASRLFLRASSLCHIARFPVLNTTLRRIIWSMQKEAYTAGTSFWKDPVKLIHIPHKHATSSEGSSIPLSYRFPSRKAGSGPVPVILCISGLDGFRIDFPGRCTNFFNSQGWAIVGAEIPGCGDCPAAKMDPESPDRLWSSVLDWIAEQPELDTHNVCVWGFSTGGYYSLRLAHTHASRLRGAIAQGLYAHHALSPEWIDVMDSGEYPSSLTRSLMSKYDYSSVEEMKADSQKRFSLVDSGILDKPCTKLLMLNGMEDTIYPIEDTLLVLQYGGPKEARLTQGRGHMGEPQAGSIGFAWIKRLFETPQFQLEEAFKIYQEALKVHSQQVLAVQDSKGQIAAKRESRVGRRQSAMMASQHVTAATEHGSPTAEVGVSPRKENGSPLSRDNRPLRSMASIDMGPPITATRHAAVADDTNHKLAQRTAEQVIRGPPATHGAVVLDRVAAPPQEERRPTTPITPASSDKSDSRVDSDTDIEDIVTEMTGNEDKRMSAVIDATESMHSFTSSNEYRPNNGLGITTVRGLKKKDSFEEHYEYSPAGIETEVVTVAEKESSDRTVKVNGLLTPESPKLEEKRLSGMFDRSSRPVSVYKNENSKWEQKSRGRTQRAETLAI